MLKDYLYHITQVTCKVYLLNLKYHIGVRIRHTRIHLELIHAESEQTKPSSSSCLLIKQSKSSSTQAKHV